MMDMLVDRMDMLVDRMDMLVYKMIIDLICIIAINI